MVLVRSRPFGGATPWRPVVYTRPASITEATRPASHPGSPSRCRWAAYSRQASPWISASGAPAAPGSAPLVTFSMDGLPPSRRISRARARAAWRPGPSASGQTWTAPKPARRPARGCGSLPCRPCIPLARVAARPVPDPRRHGCPARRLAVPRRRSRRLGCRATAWSARRGRACPARVALRRPRAPAGRPTAGPCPAARKLPQARQRRGLDGPESTGRRAAARAAAATGDDGTARGGPGAPVRRGSPSTATSTLRPLSGVPKGRPEKDQALCGP